jgi:RNA polymerase sigma-70 factor, ECF subfamily
MGVLLRMPERVTVGETTGRRGIVGEFEDVLIEPAGTPAQTASSLAIDPPSYQVDLALWEAVVARQADSVRTLVDDYLPRVYGFVLARVAGSQAAAEDLVQETLLDAMRSSSTYRGEASLTTWLCQIARSRVARFFERERRDEVVVRRINLASDVGDQIIDVRDEVLEALAGLPPLHRQVLVLKYLDGRSVQDIAGMTDRTTVQIQSLLQRARDGFRRSMERDDA